MVVQLTSDISVILQSVSAQSELQWDNTVLEVLYKALLFSITYNHFHSRNDRHLDNIQSLLHLHSFLNNPIKAGRYVWILR